MKPQRKIGYIYDVQQKPHVDMGLGLLSGIAVSLILYGLLILAL